MRTALCSFLWMILAIAAMADLAPVSIAVIDTPQTADLGALVTTELSTNSAVHLVERSDLAKIGDEAKLQQLAGSDSVALGKLAGASGLLFVDKTADGFHLCFTAVGLGYALFDDEIPAGDSPTQLAKSIAHRVAGYAPKLALDPGKAIPISVLNLRADVGSTATLALERNLTLLLESKIAAVPEFVVLERRHAWSLGFERSLDVSSKPLLRGAYLVDGTIRFPASGDNCSIALRLRQPGGGAEKSTTVQGSTKDLGALADQILAEIKKNIGRAVSESGSTPVEEGNEYLHEALWGWRSNVPDAALEAIDSAELLGAPPEDVVPLRIQILCAIANRGMEHWRPPSTETPPTFDANALAEKTDAALRSIQETVRYRDENLESKLGEFVPSNGPERLRFRTGETIAVVVYIGSKNLLLLEHAQSPRADELRRALRAITGYDPLHGKPGAVQRSNAGGYGGNLLAAFADDWAQTLEEELAFYRLACVDTEVVLPMEQLRDPSKTFCARFLTTPAQREKAFDDFVESLKSIPASQRAYLVLKTHVKDTAIADATYLDYLNYMWSFRQQVATSNDYSPLVESVWSIAGEVSQRNPKAALPLVHAVLDEEHPGLSGIIVLKILWKPAETDPADALKIWKEEHDYVKRRTDVIMQKEGRTDVSFLAEMDSVMYYFKSKFPDVVKTPLEDTATATSTPPLVVTQFWYPWLDPNTPVDNNVILSTTTVGDDSIWVVGFLNHLEKGRIYKVHLPDMQTETIAPMDGKYIQGLLWTPQALYAPLIEQEGRGFTHQLARYDFATSTWTKRDLSVGYLPQQLCAVNNIIYLATGAAGASPGDRESGMAKYDWDADKVTLLSSNRRRPAQNQFDDSPAYRIAGFFAGPGNKPGVTTDSGTFYVQETPGTWLPVFDGRFNDYVISQADRTLVFNSQGEAMLIDPKLAAPIPWMASDEPIYRKAKGLPGVTGPVPTPWASEAIWDCPPGKRKQMDGGTTAFHGNQLFMFIQPSPVENRYELLCYDKTRGRKPTHIPIKFQLTDPEKAALSLHPGRMPNGFTIDELEQPHSPFVPRLVATSQGLCLHSIDAGFWFIPYSDIDAYLKSQPPSAP